MLLLLVNLPQVLEHMLVVTDIAELGLVEKRMKLMIIEANRVVFVGWEIILNCTHEYRQASLLCVVHAAIHQRPLPPHFVFLLQNYCECRQTQRLW